MKKTLNDLLQDKKYQKTNIKVGSKSGSGFWYCGKGNLAYSLPEINKAREKLIKQSKGNLYQLQYRQKHLDDIYANTLKEAKNYILWNGYLCYDYDIADRGYIYGFGACKINKKRVYI